MQLRITRPLTILFAAVLLFSLSATTIHAQEISATTDNPSTGATPSTEKADVSAAAENQLEKAVQNPVASLVSVPVQNNTNLAYGPYNRTQDVLNIQPVIPFNLSENWMVITRIIQPIIWQPYPSQPSGGQYGLGDMVPTFFLSPRKPKKIIWGVGPVFTFPTATSNLLGQGKVSMGPSVVALAQPGHWTLGVLVNNVWSIAGSGTRSAVNQMTLQYFITYQLKKGWYVTSSPIITANWKGSSGDVWTVPFGAGIGRVTNIGFQPVNLTAQFYGNAAYPNGTSSWAMRLQIAFLFPKLSKEQEQMLLEQKLKQLQKEQATP